MLRTLFLHVPKTGGSSVLAYLKSVYKDRNCLYIKGWGDPNVHSRPEQVTAEQVRLADFIWLHAGFCELNHYTNDYFKFAFVRDPLERATSAYCFLRNPDVLLESELSHEPEHIVKLLRAIEHMSFEEFILSRQHSNWAQAHYDYYFRRCSPLYDRFSELLTSVMPALASNLNVRRACHFIDKSLEYIGLTSHLSEDMETLRGFCFPEHDVPFNNKLNVSQRDDVDLKLSRAAQKVFDEAFHKELAIYRHSVQIRTRKRSELKSQLANMP